MIYSRQLITEEPQRQDIPTGLRPTPAPAVEQPDKRAVSIKKNFKTGFGSPYTTVTLEAICEESGKVIDSVEFTRWSWETSSVFVNKKKADFADQLKEKGYTVC